MTSPDTPDLSALWPLLPPWIEWVAMDANRRWFGSMRKPKIYEAWLNIISPYWECTGDTMTIPKKYAPRWRGDWRKSLTRRPK